MFLARTGSFISGIGEEPEFDLVGLEAWWQFEETGSFDLAADAHTSGRTLFLGSGNGVETAAGIVGNAKRFLGSGLPGFKSFFQRNDAIFRRTGTQSFYFSTWVNLNSVAFQWLVSSWGGPGDRSWGLLLTGAGLFRLMLDNEEGTFVGFNFGSVTAVAGQWYFVDLFFDSVAGQAGIGVNNSSFNTISIAGLSPVATGPFKIGISHANLSPSTATVDETTFWTTPPTQARRDYLWNEGNGNTYPS